MNTNPNQKTCTHTNCTFLSISKNDLRYLQCLQNAIIKGQSTHGHETFMCLTVVN